MPVSRLRRPLFLTLMGYMILLCLLRHAGFMDIQPPDYLDSYRYLPQVELLVSLESFTRGSRRPRAFAIASRVGDIPCRERVLIWLPSGAEEAGLKSGSILKISGRMRPPRRPRNPGEFDEHGYLRDRGAALVVHVAQFQLIGQEGSYIAPLLSAAESFRNSIRRLLEATYRPEISSILSGILLGDKEALDPSFTEALKRAGAYHLIVPSGTNVTLILVFFIWLTQYAGLPRIFQFPVPLGMAAFYGLVVGCDPPYLRAYLCAVWVALVRLWDRECDLFQALSLSAFILLIWNPRILFHYGFQMSYLVVWALLMIESHPIISSHWPWLIRVILGLSLASVAAQLTLLPLLAQMGGKLSLIGIPVNIVLVPLCGALLVVGYALWGISFLPFSIFFNAAAALTGLLTEIFRKVCVVCGNLPGGALDLWPMSGWMIASYYLLLLGVFLWRTRRMACVLMASGLALGSLAYLVQRIPSRDLRVIALSVPGPGGTSLVRFPDGRNWLIYGSGPPRTVFNMLRFEGIRHLDKTILLERSFFRERYRQRILDGVRSREVVYLEDQKPLELCQGSVCFNFGSEGIELFNGGMPHGSLQSRLRRNAWEIATDGISVRYRPAQ